MGTGIKSLYGVTPLLLLAQLIRLPNLLLVALTQFIINFQIIHPGIDALLTTSRFGDFHFYLLLVVTLLITASGYLINDIHDIPSDTVNKPGKLLIGKQISISTAYWLYFCFCIFGYLLALYLAFYIKRLHFINIYLLAIGVLYAYSAYFKKKPLSGNIIVALLCAGVSGILFLAEYDALAYANTLKPGYYQYVRTIIGAYAAFAFLSTLFREIVKDLEDVEGDATANYRTVPLAWGMPAARIIALLSGLLWLLALLICWWIPELRKVAWISIPVAALVFMLYKAKAKQDYTRISFYCKWVMLGGLIILF